MDRMALEIALKQKVPCGGWCPKGRLSEDGPILAHFPLTETPSSDYLERTEWNVRDSDGTLILTWGTPTGGTAYTVQMANKYEKPVYVVDFMIETDSKSVHAWLSENEIEILNVAGPRGSSPLFNGKDVVGFLKELV